MAESCFFWSLILLYFCLWMLSSCSSNSCAIRISRFSACRICSFPPVSSHLHRPMLRDIKVYKKKSHSWRWAVFASRKHRWQLWRLWGLMLWDMSCDRLASLWWMQRDRPKERVVGNERCNTKMWVSLDRGFCFMARKNHLNGRKMLSIWTVNTDCFAMVTPPVWSVCYVLGSGMIEKVSNPPTPSLFLAFLVPLMSAVTAVPAQV